jgi:type I restriction enzyme M protein
VSQSAASSLLPPDTAVLRRRLSGLHDELRARGHNPLQALVELAGMLDRNGAGKELHDILRVDSAAGVSSLAWTAFQEFLTTDLRGAFGQYLTPPAVAEHVADLLGNLPPGMSVADPFLGSGILLDAVARKNPGIRLRGYEINDSVAQVGTTALHLAGHRPQVEIGDAFEFWARSRFEPVDAIVTNPPFGISLVTVDQRYRISPALSNLRKVPVELLALEMCINRIRQAGTLVIVLPNSVLTNTRFSAFRADFFARCTLEHVTQLSAATFAPFRGVARASVLVIRKKVPAGLPYRFGQDESRHAGYDATGRPESPTDLPAVATHWRKGAAPKAMLLETGEIVGGAGASPGRPGFRLGEISEIFRGKNPPRDQYTKSGPFLLKVGSLSGSFVSWRERERSRISEEFYQASPAKQLRPGDICFTCTAHTPRYICQKVDLITELPPSGAMPSGEVIVVRLHKDAPLSPLALLYHLRSDAGRRSVQSLIKGSTAHVYPRDLAGLIVPDLPPTVDPAVLEQLYREAEASFRRYLLAEDKISHLLGTCAATEETDR